MFAVATQLDRVTREVSDAGQKEDGTAQRTVALTQVYDVAGGQVWNALTVRERVAEWFESFTGKLAKGETIELESGTQATVKECEEGRSVDIDWSFEGDESVVRLVLTSAEGGTAFRLESTMDVTDHYDEYGPAASGVGWDLIVAALASYLAGDPLDPEGEWITADEGTRFVKDAAELWGKADVALGTDPEEAEMKAAATAEFYMTRPRA